MHLRHPRRPNRPAPAIAAAILGLLVVAATACGPSGSTPNGTAGSSGAPSQPTAGAVLPVIVSRELIAGENRLVFSFVDATNKPIAAPDRTAGVDFRGPGGESASSPAAEFVWSIEDVAGLYVTSVDFPVAGAWTAIFETEAPGSPAQSIEFSFDVKDDASVVVPGEPAPSVDTPTLADVGGDVTKISTDDEPVEAFYETSVADALAAKEPFVLVFATPKFCQTQACGPTLEKVKEVAATHPDMTIINVEPYVLEDVEGQLQPLLKDGLLQPVEATNAYGLLTEPFVFVVGGDGIVRASFEVIFTTSEIDAALAGLS